ncbi:MAG: DUF4160 domain-containing protein [Sphingomonas sp.]|uniref:DUF4160 domain-containing protein n=1 Tax=Sphingomonas sp. TaxID=28214 RepID=UPI0025F2E55C|nr:DUF4160 domain-containing protein [Sphingomonas sp.]MBY0285117.1 DUF4160 domain-containing protein [Sphingomonas sp.]
MPTVIIIDGIRIEIYTDDHPPPHFHVKAGGMRAKFDISTGELLQGSLDKRSMRKVRQWMRFNGDLLMQVWISSRPR